MCCDILFTGLNQIEITRQERTKVMERKLLSSMLAADMVVTSVFSTALVSEAKTTNVSHGTVEVQQRTDSVTIGNGAIARTFSTKNSKLSTTKIVNKRTGGGETSFTPGKDREEFIVGRQKKNQSRSIYRH